MHGYCCLNGVYKSTSTLPLAFVFSKRGVSDIGCSLVALATRTICFCSSVPAANIMTSGSSLFLFTVWLLTHTSCTISIGTGSDLFRTIFCSAGKISFTILTMKGVSGRMKAAKSLTIPHTTLTRVYLILTCGIILPTTATFWFVTLRSRLFLKTRNELIQWCLSISSRCRFCLAPVSKTQYKSAYLTSLAQ